MELEGLKHRLDHLQQEQVAIAKLATDRQVQVRAHMKREAVHQAKFQCLAFSKVCSEEAIQKSSISHVRH